MDKIIKNILIKIENAGFESYLVGGYVRDYLLGVKTYDVDICTNALPKDLHLLFPNNSNSNTYGGFNLKIKKYNIDITTFRKEISYSKRKPTEIVYINDLSEDIKRRDFTINSVCMNSKDKIIDLVNGVKDINNKTIRMLGNIDERLMEDPLRILRAIRFSCVLDFQIDCELDKSITNNYKLVNTLSDVRIKSELNKILMSKNYLKGLELLDKYHILDLLKIKYKNITYVNDLSGMWAQLEISQNYGFTKQELLNIINIRQIVKEGKIDNFILYKYGLYSSLVAADILNINRKIINKMYNRLPIKDIKELQISSEEIIKLLNISPSKEIQIIKNDLVNSILSYKIKNKNNELRKEILKRME